MTNFPYEVRGLCDSTYHHGIVSDDGHIERFELFAEDLYFNTYKLQTAQYASEVELRRTAGAVPPPWILDIFM